MEFKGGKMIRFAYTEDESLLPSNAKEVRVFVDPTGMIFLVAEEHKPVDVQIKNIIDNMDASKIDTYAEICAAIGKKIG